MNQVHSGDSEDSKWPNGGPPTQATLVIRVWSETESPQPFRARIIAESSKGGEPRVSYARGQEEVVAAVDSWLRNLPDGNLPAAE